ncbi:uncharacterized protein EAF02_006112 [Botrytis sinoallii]|uniref:uncharacterized protein n=1 Tax=Botrytis sinoallii TaxID=1463999 RepID=UPI001901E52F|nr:uncharacterized protein EAF02_006112 [Botrytis sinoallii]KAF7882749.1 hypothetical protein EAF02_006112 [Botrytis sinoallii]
MSDKSPREISYFWKDALQWTIFCGINPVDYPAFKNGHFNSTILEGSDPLQSLEELRNSKELSDEEKAVVEGCIKVSKPLFNNPTYNSHNPFLIEYEDLWNEVKKLNQMFGNDGVRQGRCSVCTKRVLEIEYIFDENRVLKRMATDDAVPVEELRPRLWDPKFHDSFMRARDRQSTTIPKEYTLSDREFVVEPTDDTSSGSTEDELKEGVANDLDELVERDEMNVRGEAKAESTDDGDELAADLSDKFGPLTLIGTDEKAQE